MAMRTKALMANIVMVVRTNWVLGFLGTCWNQQHALGAEEASFDERDARASAVLGSAKTNS